MPSMFAGNQDRALLPRFCPVVLDLGTLLLYLSLSPQPRAHNTDFGSILSRPTKYMYLLQVGYLRLNDQYITDTP